MKYLTVDGKYLTLNDKLIAFNPPEESTGQEQSKTVTPTTEQQTVTPDSGYRLSSVIVNPIPDNYIVPSGTKEITTNGTHDVKNYESATVNVPSETQNLQEKTVTENGEVTPDSGYDGLSKVTVNVPATTPQTQTKTVTPTKETQNVTPDDGYYLSGVTIDPIPSNYIDTSDGTATPSDIASGKTAYVNGEKITGTHTCPAISFDESTGVLTITS